MAVDLELHHGHPIPACGLHDTQSVISGRFRKCDRLPQNAYAARRRTFSQAAMREKLCRVSVVEEAENSYPVTIDVLLDHRGMAQEPGFMVDSAEIMGIAGHKNCALAPNA